MRFAAEPTSPRRCAPNATGRQGSLVSQAALLATTCQTRPVLRWAILGTGFISNTIVEAINQSEGSTVHAVAGRRSEAVADFQAQHGIPHGYLGYSEAIADPDVDVVYIGTPNHEHHPLVIAAAEAGKAVLSEKSLTTTMASAHELVNAVRGRMFFVEGLMYLAHPMYRAFEDLLTSDRTGTVRSIHGRYAANIAHLVNPLGRGTIYNLGCYPVSLLHLVMRTAFGADAFHNRVVTAVGTRTADDTIGSATASIRFANGVLASVSSTDDYGMAHAFSVLTDQGELSIDTNPWLPAPDHNTITWRPYDGAAETVTIADGRDAFFHQIRVVENALAAGETEAPHPSPQLDDSLAIMGLLTEWERLALDTSSS